MFKIIVIGTGTAFVTRYHNTSFVLDVSNEYFLVDGTGGNEILAQFEAKGLDWAKLHNAFLSHAHTDHLLGMIWVIRIIAYKIINGNYKGNFTLYGHEELIASVRKICKLCLQPKECDLFDRRIFFVSVHDHETFPILNYKFTFFDILSNKAKQFGFLLIYGAGKKLVFLGDEPVSEGMKIYLQNADWMLSEAFCLYTEREIHTPYKYFHSTVREASENAMKYHVKNLILWHTEDSTTYGQRRKLYTRESRIYYNGNIWVPEDGDVITIS